MNFDVVRESAKHRFNEVYLNLIEIGRREPLPPTGEIPQEAKVQNGLFYVHLYAALEKTINEVVQSALLRISSENVKNKEYIIPFHAIASGNKIKSMRDGARHKLIENSVLLFEHLQSDTPATINEVFFANSLQNIWSETIIQTLSAFGIKDFKLNPRERTMIDEVVDKRNAVAHGREMASVVGERHRALSLNERYNVIQEVAYRVIDSLDSYCHSKHYIAEASRGNYLVASAPATQSA